MLPFLLIAGVALIAGALLWPAPIRQQNLAARRRDFNGRDFNERGFDGRRPPAPTPRVVVWRAATKAERRAAVTSIRAQLDAFRRDDYTAAMLYQSIGLSRNFASIKDFRNMMKLRYPQFAHYASVRFGQARCDTKAQYVAVPVAVTGRDKVRVTALYFMTKEKGLFRVAGVQPGSPVSRRRSVEA